MNGRKARTCSTNSPSKWDTEDGVIWVYGVEEHAVLALSEEGIDCLRDLLSEHKRDHQ